MTKRIHTYSDGSKIEMGAHAGRGWLAVIKQGQEAVERAIAPSKRQVIACETIRAVPTVREF